MIYAGLTRLAEPLLRLRAGLGGSDALRQRLVMDAPPAADIWIHGASVGELTSARAIIEDLAQDFELVITTNTETARQMATDWGFRARLAPMDLPGALRRFLEAVRPQLQITIEGEFWPLRAAELARRKIPQAMIGARISAGSARNWGRFPGLIRPILQNITALSAQDPASEARLLELGLPRQALMARVDLKLLGPAQITPPAPDHSRNSHFLAASTHEGEEGAILDAYVAATARHPALRLILAIRHPQRGDEVAALIADRGLPVARRSRGDEDGPVLLVDKLGEMGRWYAAAALCLVGGSLTDRGGHTPWEPAAYRCAILHGTHVSNFAEGYAALDQADAARSVTSEDLAGKLDDLIDQPELLDLMGTAARRVLDQRAGSAGPLIATLRDLAKRGG